MEIGCRDDNLFRFIDPHKFLKEKVTSVFTKHHDGRFIKKNVKSTQYSKFFNKKIMY